MLVSIVTFGTILRWVYRVNCNARCWSDAVTISPAWNVISFFIPVVSLFHPSQGIRQSWSATGDPGAPEAVAAPQWMELWWQLWVATMILCGGINRLQIQSGNEKATLLMPLRDLDETWRVALSPTAPGEVAAPSILRWWWGSWLVATVSDALATLLPATAPAGPWLILLAAVAALPLAGTACRIITRLSTLQHEAIRLQ